MKIKYEMDNNCVECSQGCIHCDKGNYRVPIAIECDVCGENCFEIYQDDDGINRCIDCLLNNYTRISIEEIEEYPDNFEDEEWI